MLEAVVCVGPTPVGVPLWSYLMNSRLPCCAGLPRDRIVNASAHAHRSDAAMPAHPQMCAATAVAAAGVTTLLNRCQRNEASQVRDT